MLGPWFSEIVESNDRLDLFIVSHLSLLVRKMCKESIYKRITLNILFQIKQRREKQWTVREGLATPPLGPTTPPLAPFTFPPSSYITYLCNDLIFKFYSKVHSFYPSPFPKLYIQNCREANIL